VSNETSNLSATCPAMMCLTDAQLAKMFLIAFLVKLRESDFFLLSVFTLCHLIEWFYLGRAQTALPYSGRSLSIAVKAHLHRAGVVHSAQCVKHLCIILYHNVSHQKHEFWLSAQ
jgi:hypothetical protein